MTSASACRTTISDEQHPCDAHDELRRSCGAVTSLQRAIVIPQSRSRDRSHKGVLAGLRFPTLRCGSYKLSAHKHVLLLVLCSPSRISKWGAIFRDPPRGGQRGTRADAVGDTPAR